MADSPCNCDLPPAKRPRMLSESSAGDALSPHLLQAGAAVGAQATVTQSRLTGESCDPRSAFPLLSHPTANQTLLPLGGVHPLLY